MRRWTNLLLLLLMFGCNNRQKNVELPSRLLVQVYDAMTEVMVRDVTNPPLAARFFAYASLAGHEVVAKDDSTIKTMKGKIKAFEGISFPVMDKPYHTQAAAIFAMIETAKRLQPSGYLLDSLKGRMVDSMMVMGLNDEKIEASMQLALQVSEQVIAFAKTDGYNRISNFARYSPTGGEGYWYPTPPAFMAAVEPYFNTVRPFFLSSGDQFKPREPIAFSKDKNSPFHIQMRRNYEEKLDDNKKHIAAFWDCNPFVVQEMGHLMVGVKKISPGAHWMGITGIACGQAGKSFNESVKISTIIAMGLMDGFICCWDEKYRSNRIRPETAIRKYIDPSWKPLLQTPPFPEYLSGHSVVSTVSAGILESYFGPNFNFTDTVEQSYGLPPRNFSSFNQAAEEASISRFYGGIHFMDAIVEGQEQGRRISQYILQKLNTPSNQGLPENSKKISGILMAE